MSVDNRESGSPEGMVPPQNTSADIPQTPISRRRFIGAAIGLAATKFLGSEHNANASTPSSGIKESLDSIKEIPKDELINLWEKAGLTFDFGKGFIVDAPTISYPDDETLHYFGHRSDLLKGFPNFGLLNELHDESKDGHKAYLSDVQGTYITNSKHIVETSQGPVETVLIHTLHFMGDPEQGDVIKMGIPFRIGWTGNEKFKGATPGYGEETVTTTKPKSTNAKQSTMPVEKILERLEENKERKTLKVMLGVPQVFSPSLQDQAAEIGFPIDFYSEAYMDNNASAQRKLYNDLRAITGLVARDQEYMLYKGDQPIEITEAQVGKLTLEERLTRLPKSEDYYNKSYLTLDEFAKIPTAMSVYGFLTNDASITIK